jgi:hypothetical protein
MTSLLTIDEPRTLGGYEVRLASRHQWIELAAAFRDHNYRHCWDFSAAMGKRSNASVENVVVACDGQPVALASVRLKPLRAARTGIAYVSGGPLVRRAGESDAAAQLALGLKALKEEYAARRRMVLRVAPAPGDAAWNAVQAGIFEAAGFATAQHLPIYRSIFVDVSRPLADVRAGLAPKWRNHLNKAERQEIGIAERWDASLFSEFASLFDELIARKGFEVPLGSDFYADVQARLPETERLLLAIAWIDDAPAAGVVAGLHGDTAVYLLGASNDAGRKGNASYRLQWKVMEAAASRGCRWYDLGGVDSDANPGVYKFKLGFGGEERESPGPYEFAGDRLRWTAVRAAERAYRMAANVRRPG